MTAPEQQGARMADGVTDAAPTVPLFSEGWGDPTLAERVDELLAETGFGT